MTSCLGAGILLQTGAGGVTQGMTYAMGLSMRFDWVTILAALTFVSIVVTLLLTVASYVAYKVREGRLPKSGSKITAP